MTANAIAVTRTSLVLRPDAARVLLRPFQPGDAQRVSQIVGRILLLPDEQVSTLLEQICAEFCRRHSQIHKRFQVRFEQVREQVHELLAPDTSLSEQRCQLIGSYFLAEYSLESAALFNPSIVPHPDQTGVQPGAVRFILSLRATGEGHVSSITFRTGVIHPGHRIEVSPPDSFLTEPRQIPNPQYEKPLFGRKLQELGLTGDFARRLTRRLAATFSLQELRNSIDEEMNRERDSGGVLQEDLDTAQGIWLVARSNCEVQFEPHQRISERIIFPATPSQHNGIEDARFVHFRNDDGSSIYYATFTAFDGKVVVPELVETGDFLRFRFTTLNGPAAQNKGMALFPRKIAGRYAMLSRQDNESISLMFSDNVHFWNEREILLKPAFSWELVQIGNCGSPIETEAGWLVLSHGVGPMRKYCIGAFLLDLKDPRKVIGRLAEPLLQPHPEEREGYVPNVVYTCGALLHGRRLIIPYGLADQATGFASVALDDVLAAMRPEAC
ncbi:MAG: glycoside hydrolase family 130 protein [Acidobacteria bacterium]|nr:glycoside hydrolase family 130 protein [Acidobacteriota bacterium]